MDNAFKTAAYPGYTTDELRRLLNVGMIGAELTEAGRVKIQAEIDRRERAASGDMSVMTDGERLRFIRTGKAR